MTKRESFNKDESAREPAVKRDEQRQLSLQRRRGRLGTESEEQRETRLQQMWDHLARSMIQNNLAQNDIESQHSSTAGISLTPLESNLCQASAK